MKSPYDIILRPVMTEKSYNDLLNKKYVFIVHSDAKRHEIKEAVEHAFGVQVQKVNTLNQLGKIKRQGRSSGRRASTRKAYVTLKPESKAIEFFEGMV